jgi:hypothetical protein
MPPVFCGQEMLARECSFGEVGIPSDAAGFDG